MKFKLKLSPDTVYQSEVEQTPCIGRVAKAIGKCKLRERCPGLTVEFESYQPAEGQPEQDLADDEPVVPDCILNFTAKRNPLLDLLAQHDKLLQGLFRPRLESVLCEYAAALAGDMTTRVSEGSLAVTIDSNESQSSMLAGVLKAAGSDQTASQFASALDDVCAKGNERQKGVNSKAALRAELKRLHDAGVGELMAGVMPEAALLVSKYDIFLSLLPS